MTKKISVLVLLIGIFICGFKEKQEEFTYTYEIILNSNNKEDVIKGYLYKEYLIDRYNQLINYLDPSLHTNAIKENIDSFAYDNSVSKYVDGKIVVYVGESKGDSLKGELKTNACDTSKVRVKFFFSKFFVK